MNKNIQQFKQPLNVKKKITLITENFLHKKIALNNTNSSNFNSRSLKKKNITPNSHKKYAPPLFKKKNKEPSN